MLLRISAITLFTITLIATACFRTSLTTNTSAVVPAPEYNPNSSGLHPEYRIIHEQNNKTKLYFRLPTSELIYLKTDNKQQAQLIAYYEIIPSIQTPVLSDSAFTRLNLTKIPKQTDMIAFLEIKPTEYQTYWLKIKLEDKYSRRTSVSYVKVDTKTKDNSQFYFALNYKTKRPYLKDYMSEKDSVIIQYFNKSVNHLVVKYYDTNFGVSLPPFTELSPRHSKILPDSVFQITCAHGAAVFYPHARGLYRIQADTAENKGLTIVLFDNHYPNFRTSEQLVNGLQYITSDAENMVMNQSTNKKLAVDNFWLKTTNDTERARELLKIWYLRAQYANYYFPSYKEGWKTDRGMIYMVFGPPQVVEFSETGERWTYTEKADFQPIHFIFKRNDSNVSDQDLTLVRDNSYQSFWYEAVETWRQGIVYHYSP